MLEITSNCQLTAIHVAAQYGIHVLAIPVDAYVVHSGPNCVARCMAAVQSKYSHLLRGGTLPGKGPSSSWDHLKPKPPKRKPRQPRAPPIPQLVEEDEEEEGCSGTSHMGQHPKDDEGKGLSHGPLFTCNLARPAIQYT